MWRGGDDFFFKALSIKSNPLGRGRGRHPSSPSASGGRIMQVSKAREGFTVKKTGFFGIILPGFSGPLVSHATVSQKS